LPEELRNRPGLRNDDAELAVVALLRTCCQLRSSCVYSPGTESVAQRTPEWLVASSEQQGQLADLVCHTRILPAASSRCPTDPIQAP
jgi:hypothetical protein